MDMGDIEAKFNSFGWFTQTVDGHDPKRIKTAITEAKKAADKPSAIILDTVKGYGWNFAEGVTANHHMNFSKEQIDSAIEAAEQRLEYVRELAKGV
jgi:transketolase